MKPSTCFYCEPTSGKDSKLVRSGRYYRTSDSSWVQRYRCGVCKKTFSKATFDFFCYRQKKRLKNRPLVALLCSGVSQRRAALLLKINRKTVVRIFRTESIRSLYQFRTRNAELARCEIIEFDDLETFEQTKSKPLSVTLAVEHKTRRILGVEVSRMPASGKLTKKSRELYGYRKDERRLGRHRLFSKIAGHVLPNAVIKSDQSPHYPRDVAKFFPGCRHVRYKGKRGSLTGQGEIKRVKFDPLFSLNHTCAMLRANVNRLFRKTWCTTKRADQLEAHLFLYAAFHNSVLIPQPAKTSPVDKPERAFINR